MLSKNRRFCLLAMLCLLLLSTALVGCVQGAQTSPQEKVLEKASLRMSMSPTTRWAPFLLGIDKGFYEEEGIDLDVRSAKGSTIAVKLVAAGTDEFGMASGNTVLTGRSKGMPLVSTGVLFQRSPTSVMYMDDGLITSPADLEGMTIASDPESTKRQEFIAFARKTGVDTETIDFLSVAGSQQEIGAFLSGDADAFLTYYHKTEVILEEQGVTGYSKMVFDDYGLHLYSQSLITREDVIEQNPDLVRRFMRATLRSWEYALDNPEEAVESLVSHYPGLGARSEFKNLMNLHDLVVTEETWKNGLGHQTTEGWEMMQDTLYGLDVIGNKIDVTEMYTNRFLNE